mmetsp:Transcript_4334/g.9805  ORF Transcript_4334/g.9805 Transcript_4334/m.9805 type:complete len:407 (+) Transcript_4334:94-1314(+)
MSLQAILIFSFVCCDVSVFLLAHNLRGNLHLLAHLELVELADLQAHERLEQSRSVVASGEVAVLQHLLRQLAVELARRVAEVRLEVDELLELVELSVELEHAHVLAVPRVRSVEHFEARVRARELASARDPRDGGALVEQVRGVEHLLALLLDHAHAQNLAVGISGDELRGEHLDDDVRELLLRVDVRVEVRLACLDGRLDGLQGVSTLRHVALDLPRELDLVGDVEVDGEVAEVAHALVHERVKSLDDEDLRRLDLLRRVHDTRDVVVDALVHALSLLERLDLLVHEVELLLLDVQRRLSGHLASLAIVEVVVVEADDGRHVTEQRVAVGVSAGGRRGVTSEHLRHTTHERRLATSGVRRESDDDGVERLREVGAARKLSTTGNTCGNTASRGETHRRLARGRHG